MINCPECNHKNNDWAKMCVSCGNILDSSVKPAKKKSKMTTIIIIVICIFLFVSFSNIPPKNIDGAIKDALGNKLKSSEVFNYVQDESKKIVKIHFIASDNLTASYIKMSMLQDTANVCEKILSTSIPIRQITVVAYFPLTDKYGNESNTCIMTLSINGETLKKINWDNINKTKFNQLADEYWEHPAIRGI